MLAPTVIEIITAITAVLGASTGSIALAQNLVRGHRERNFVSIERIPDQNTEWGGFRLVNRSPTGISTTIRDVDIDVLTKSGWRWKIAPITPLSFILSGPSTSTFPLIAGAQQEYSIDVNELPERFKFVVTVKHSMSGRPAKATFKR